VSWASNITGIRKNQITLNGVLIAGTQIAPGSDGVQSLQVSTTAVLAVDDVISVYVYQDSTGVLDVTSTRINMGRLF
jgi:hypothetical protein